MTDRDDLVAVGEYVALSDAYADRIAEYLQEVESQGAFCGGCEKEIAELRAESDAKRAAIPWLFEGVT